MFKNFFKKSKKTKENIDHIDFSEDKISEVTLEFKIGFLISILFFLILLGFQVFKGEIPMNLFYIALIMLFITSFL